MPAKQRRAQRRFGMLLYSDGNFMQALEGEEASADALAKKIERDPRHHGMRLMLRQPTA